MTKNLCTVQRLKRIQKLMDCYLLAFKLRTDCDSFYMCLQVMNAGMCQDNDTVWRTRFQSLLKSSFPKEIMDFLKESAKDLFDEYLNICQAVSEDDDLEIDKEEAEAFHCAFAEIVKAVNCGLVIDKQAVCEETLRKLIEEAVIIGKRNN